MPRLVHFEIHATHPDVVADFYTKMFDWRFEKWDGPVDYRVIYTGPKDKPGIDGGLIQRMGPAPEGPVPVAAFVCTMEVDSVDAYTEKALKLGGSVALPKMPIPSVGWLIYCKDPDGNIFGMMQTDPAAK